MTPRTSRLAPLLAASLLLAAGAAGADVFTVTKTADTADGLCNADCSLREAVIAANETIGGDTIVVPAGTYSFALGTAGEDAAVSGDLDITSSQVAILGAGADRTAIDANALDRVFHVLPEASLSLYGLTVRNGRLDGQGGAGIRNQGTLDVVACQIISNTSTGFSFGGGLSSDISATLRDSVVAGNAAEGGGGGIVADGLLVLRNVTLSTNQSVLDFGGGLYAFSGASVVINNSTITANTAGQNAGGVLLEGAASAVVRNSILAGNTGATAADCQGNFNSGGHNLIGSNNACNGFVDGVDGDLVGTTSSPLAAELGPLAGNGGPTYTHVPLAGSPAIDHGNPAAGPGGNSCESGDQRGLARPIDGDGDTVARCDIGAVEVTAQCLTTATALCLNSGRFKVSIDWATPLGTSGKGQAVQLTDDSGYFWFFGADNIEVTLKVLDACAPPFERYWVFASGLTNVEVEIRVEDTQTSTVRTYRNPQGTSFQPVLDSDAFNTCP